MKKILLFSLVIAGFGISGASAQVGAVMNQVDTTQTRSHLNHAAEAALTESNSVPQLYEGEADDLGPQSVVQAKERRKLFEAYADAQYFYTDNVLLRERDKINTEVLVSTIEAALAPTAYPLGGGTFAPRLGYRHQWFDFGLDGKVVPGTGGNLKLNALDFNVQTVFADALWVRGNWSFGAGLDTTRLMDTATYHQFYEELVPNWSARRTFSLCDKTAFAISYSGDYRATRIAPKFGDFATSDTSDRTDHSVTLTFTHVLCQHAVFEPYYQMQYTHFTAYPQGPRNDYLNSVGAGLYFLICPNFSVRTFVNYDILTSGNPRVDDYRQLDAGGGIDLSIRF